MDLVENSAEAGELGDGILPVMEALSCPTRIKIIEKILKHGEVCVGEIVKSMGVANATVSQHLGKMRLLGVVESRRDGITIYYRLRKERIAAALRQALEVLGT